MQLGYTLSIIDILLHSYCPYITNYLYLLCFKHKDLVLLESWPKINIDLINNEIENYYRQIETSYFFG